MEKFVDEKRACGYSYHEPCRILQCLDRFLSQQELASVELPRDITRDWLSKRSHESPATHQGRITAVRQFAKFLGRLGCPTYVPDAALWTRCRPTFTPRILTHAEMRKLLDAVDRLRPTARSPLRHLVMPEVFRLLYGCGLRVGEALRLRIRDVDLNQGILTVRQGKFRKDRLVPPALPLVTRLTEYADALGHRPAEAAFFPAPHGGRYRSGAIYGQFRRLLLQCGIPHGGRGQGPRVHDLRHGFAVHTLLRWHREGAAINAKLPLLATYLGHQDLSGTQQYLHLTAELFPEVRARVEAVFGEVIPGRLES
jgi:integrase